MRRKSGLRYVLVCGVDRDGYMGLFVLPLALHDVPPSSRSPRNFASALPRLCGSTALARRIDGSHAHRGNVIRNIIDIVWSWS